MDEPLEVGIGEEVHDTACKSQHALLSGLLFLVKNQMETFVATGILIYPAR